MEPLSIACTVGAVGKGVYTVVAKLSTFFMDANYIDETTKGLTHELEGLKMALSSIEDGLKLTALRLASDNVEKGQRSNLWGALDGNLKSCDKTIDQLNEVLENQLRGANSSLINRATRQIKLNLKKDQIMSWRTQIHIHTNALNLALHMVNVYTTSMVPSAVIGDLGPRIEELKAMMERTPSAGPSVGKIMGSPPNSRALDNSEPNGRSADPSSGDDASQTPSKADAFEQLEKLKESARTIISDAATIFAQSEAGGSVIDEPVIDPNRIKTLSWLSNSDRPPTLALSSPRAPPTASEGGESHQTPHTEHGLFQMDDDTNNESGEDYDFEVDEVAKYMVMGREKFTKSQYADATKFLLQGIAKANDLPPDRRDLVDLLKSKLTLAECYFHMNDMDSAKRNLTSLIDQQAASKNKGSNISQAHHLLAQVLLLQGQVDDAEKSCKLALKGRRKLRSSNQLYESEALMSEICMAKGDVVATELYREMIPEDLRESIIARIRKVPTAPNAPETETPSVPPHPNGLSVMTEESKIDLPGHGRPSLGHITSPAGARVDFSDPSTLTPTSTNRVELKREESIASNFSDSSTLTPTSTTRSRSSFSGLFKPKTRQQAPSPIPISSPGSVSATGPLSPRSSVARPRSYSSQTGPIPFCQSACWIRERGLKGGMASRTEPVGVMSSRTRSFWKCKDCAFQSIYFPTAPKQAAMEELELAIPTRPRSPGVSPTASPPPSRTGYASATITPTSPPSAVTVLNPTVRCKWVFLAKSHLRMDRAPTGVSPESPSVLASAIPQPLFGCVFCEEQATAIGSWPGPEALLRHIVGVHGADMSPAVKARHRIVVGRNVTPGEKWDLVLPVGLEG